jgi:hypothetical protein
MPSDSVISRNQSDCNGVKACLVQCGLCHGTSGAFRRTVKGQWVHAFCAEVMICVSPIFLFCLVYLHFKISPIFLSGCWRPHSEEGNIMQSMEW